MTEYHLSARSRKELRGVSPALVAIVDRAIEITDQDFTVVDGLRTMEEQREYVRRGVSQTMHSLHLPQSDGLGHAVDLVPYINGQPRWETPACYIIAKAVAKAVSELGYRVKWGGAWCELQDGCDPEALVHAYVDQRRASGRSAFVDAVHYQLV